MSYRAIVRKNSGWHRDVLYPVTTYRSALTDYAHARACNVGHAELVEMRSGGRVRVLRSSGTEGKDYRRVWFWRLLRAKAGTL